jgi:hypothetical protein
MVRTLVNFAVAFAFRFDKRCLCADYPYDLGQGHDVDRLHYAVGEAKFVKIYFAMRDVLSVSDWRRIHRNVAARKDLSRRVAVSAGLRIRTTAESVYERVVCQLRKII